MPWLSPELTFHRGGPFYGLVLGYLCQVHGFIELVSRGLVLRSRGLSAEGREAFAASLDGRKSEAARRTLGGGVTELLDAPKLASLVSDPVKVDTSALGTALLLDHDPAIQNFNLQSAGALAVVAWEHSASYRTQDPLWEFLRHVRNAAAHGGSFYFRGKEPSRPATWRGRAINRNLQGTPLFSAPVATGFLGSGDLLHLLSDIDRDFLAPTDPPQ